MTTDPRGRRIAVVADSLFAQRLPELERDGWGVIQLPPAGLDPETDQGWLELAAEQVAEYQRTGHEIVLIDDGTRRAALAGELARLGAAPL